jgi:hypothetical protein
MVVNEEFELASDFFVVEIFLGISGVFAFEVTNETEHFDASLDSQIGLDKVALNSFARANLSIFFEELSQVIIVKAVRKIFDVQIAELVLFPDLSFDFFV